jgi:hypothetical protein
VRRRAHCNVCRAVILPRLSPTLSLLPCPPQPPAISSGSQSYAFPRDRLAGITTRKKKNIGNNRALLQDVIPSFPTTVGKVNHISTSGPLNASRRGRFWRSLLCPALDSKPALPKITLLVGMAVPLRLLLSTRAADRLLVQYGQS